MAGRIFTVPNQLTFLRLVFLPFFVIVLYYDRYGWALAILVAAALSDALDGLLARRLNQKTALGAYLDPIADKLMLSSSFLILALKGRIAWWLTLLVLSRDVLTLAAAAVILLVVGYRPFPPSLYGKASTLTQMLLIVLVIAGGAGMFTSLPFDRLETILTFLAAAFIIASGVHYSLVIARKLSGT